MKMRNKKIRGETEKTDRNEGQRVTKKRQKEDTEGRDRDERQK